MSEIPLPMCPSVCRRLGLLAITLVYIVPSFGQNSSLPEEMKRQADRWIELERRIAEERSKWKVDKEILTASRDVLVKEQASLQQKSDANEVATNLFVTRLEKARNQLGNYEEARTILNAAYEDLERRLRALAPRLPTPLQEKIDPLLGLLDVGTEDDPTPVSQRTQAITSILSAIDQFNNTLTLTHELKADASGIRRDVKVLYWGTAVAYATQGDGSSTWMLTPGSEGWEWHDAGDYASEIDKLFAVYEKERSPELLPLPLHRQGGAR